MQKKWFSNRNEQRMRTAKRKKLVKIKLNEREKKAREKERMKTIQSEVDVATTLKKRTAAINVFVLHRK